MREVTSSSEQPQNTESTPTPKRTRKTRASAPRIGFVPATPIAAKDAQLFGRITILDIQPDADDDIFAARVQIGEPYTVQARVFGEAHTNVRATVVVKSQRGRVMARVPMRLIDPELDMWQAMVQAGAPSTARPWDEAFAEVAKQCGNWKIAIEGWEDSYATWVNDATAVLENGTEEDTEIVLARGAELLTRWAANRDAGLDAAQRKALRETAKEMMSADLPAESRFALAQIEEITALHETNPLREGLTASRDRVFHVERPQSTFSARYRLAPWNKPVDGTDAEQRTLHTALADLERAQQEGFSVVSVPSVFPKGEIGCGATAQDQVNPTLGTMDDFAAFCTRAHELGLEVALDFSLCCAAGNPWLTEHPEWFRSDAQGNPVAGIKADGTPKHCFRPAVDHDLIGIEREIDRVLGVWIEAGVTAFNVTCTTAEPVRFWQDVITAATKKHPEVLFFASREVRPTITRALSYAGFTTTQGAFTGSIGKEDLEHLLATTNSDAGFYTHAAFCPATATITPDYLRNNGISGYAIRAVLAAMGSPTWGVPSGYEFAGTDTTDWERTDEFGIAGLLTALNRIRSEQLATQSYHTLTVLPSANSSILAFARHTPAQFSADGKPCTIIVVVNLDCYNEQQSSIHVDLNQFGLPTDGTYQVRDLLTDRTFDWSWDNFVALAPWADVAHILRVEY